MRARQRRALDITAAEFYCRDDVATGRRLMVEKAPDGELGAVLTIIETGREYLRVRLDLVDLEGLVEKLTALVEHDNRALCGFCDSLGLVDGPRGPEFCDHDFN